MVRKIIKWWPVLFVSALLFVPKISLAAGWVNIGFTDQNVKTVTVDPKNNQHILVSLTSQLNSNYNYYTEDGGSAWQPVSLGGPVTNCNNFAINPKLPTEIWTGCAVGVFHSTDAGKTFSSVTNYQYLQAAFVNVATDGTVYVSSQGNNLFRSADGVVWETLNVPGSSTIPIVFTNKYNASEIYLSHSGGTNPGLYKSSDHGSRWQLLNNQFPIRNGVAQIAFEASGKICVSAGIVGIGCSIDGGFSWTQFGSPNPDKPIEYQHFYNLVQNPDDDANNIILAGTWSGQDTKIYGYQSTATTPSVFDSPQMVGSISVSQGVTYVYASNPGWTKGLWRNDGIAVMPEYLKKHPIIIVPGILGSWYTDKWVLDPILGTYDDLYYNLVNAGYVPDKDIFVFPYQWRNDNKYTAGLLATKIKEAKQKSGSSKVDIIAHSMGGLVVRSYVESDYYQFDVNKVFFLGTPQKGSVSAYPLWSAGYTGFEDLNIGIVLKFLLTEEPVINGYYGSDSTVRYLRSEVPSMGQLLPNFSYLDNKIYPECHPTNNYLDDLNNKVALIGLRGVSVVNIMGVINNSTLGSFQTDGIKHEPLWEYGEPIGLTSGNIYDGVSLLDGDGTVDIGSQSFVTGKNIFLAEVKHGNLPKEAINAIYSELGINTHPRITASINKILMIGAHSPIDFYIQAPDGKKIGFNKDGLAFNEVEGAFYTGNDSKTEFLTIPDPIPGEYKVVTYGTGTGSYEIEATYADDESNMTVTSSYLGQAAPGKVDNLLVELSPTTNQIDTKIDDKTAPITTILTEESQNNGLYNTDVKIALSATDSESGVAKTEYSLDGLLWQEYLSPFVLSEDGEVIIQYRSADKAGNIENVRNQLIKIDKTSPNVEVRLDKSVYTHWDVPGLRCTVSDAYSGVASFDVKLDGFVVECNKPIDLFNRSLGVHRLEWFASDIAGNTASGGMEFKIVANYFSTLRDIIWLYNNNHFKSYGNVASLSAHIGTSQMFDILGVTKRSTASLLQTQLLLEKQSAESKISSYGYGMITKDIKYILEGK